MAVYTAAADLNPDIFCVEAIVPAISRPRIVRGIGRSTANGLYSAVYARQSDQRACGRHIMGKSLGGTGAVHKGGSGQSLCRY